MSIIVQKLGTTVKVTFFAQFLENLKKKKLFIYLCKKL